MASMWATLRDRWQKHGKHTRTALLTMVTLSLATFAILLIDSISEIGSAVRTWPRAHALNDLASPRLLLLIAGSAAIYLGLAALMLAQNRKRAQAWAFALADNAMATIVSVFAAITGALLPVALLERVGLLPSSLDLSVWGILFGGLVLPCLFATLVSWLYEGDAKASRSPRLDYAVAGVILLSGVVMLIAIPSAPQSHNSPTDHDPTATSSTRSG